LLQGKEVHEYVIVDELCPSEPSKKYDFIQKLKKNGLTVKTAMLTYSHGNNVGSIHFLWKVTDSSHTYVHTHTLQYTLYMFMYTHL